jgi:hypothetical protein
MKKVLLMGAFVAFGLGAGCGGPCDELSDLCDGCQDGTTKSSCNNIATTYKATIGGSTLCQSVLDSGTYNSCK